MKPLLLALTLLLPMIGCRPDMTECIRVSEDWLKVQCQKEPNGSACPEHERYEESRMILAYNCQNAS